MIIFRGAGVPQPAPSLGGSAAFIRQFTDLTASGQTGFPPAQNISRSISFPSNLLAGSTILIFATQSNGAGIGGTISWSDSYGSSYALLQQVDDDQTPDWQSTYLYAAYNVPGGACTLNATFAVLIWQGIVAIEVAGVLAAPLVTSNKSQQNGVGTGANLITVAGLAGGSSPAIIIGGVSTGSDANGAPNHGTGFTEYLKDWNWGGAEGTPNLPSFELESKFSSNPGTTAVTWTAAGAGDDYNAIGVILLSA